MLTHDKIKISLKMIGKIVYNIELQRLSLETQQKYSLHFLNIVSELFKYSNFKKQY